jgi:uncharacterized protein YjiS (DUF1127 family)
MTKLLDQIALLARRWGTYLRVRNELEAYSDRDLNDIGISRADITRIALEAASLVKRDVGKRASAEDRRPTLLRQRFSPYL